MKKARRGHVCRVDALALVRAHGVRRPGVLRYGQMRALCKQPDRVGKVHALQLHDELYDRSALVTAEAIEKLRLRVYGERRRFFVVERTQPPGAPALALEADILGDNLLNADARTQFVQPCV